MSASNKERKVPVLVDKPMDFCPGCGHGIISRLIMECLDELEQSDNIIFPMGVGCSSNLGAGLECDRLHCSQYPGTGAVVCTDTKRTGTSPRVTVPPGMNEALECTSSSAGSASGATDHRPLPYTPSDEET